jgi:hypothetical protein
MKRIYGTLDKLFAVSVYSRAKEGDFTARTRVREALRNAGSSALKADAALRGILASLRAMREICQSCADCTQEAELVSRQEELETLKEEISRLSKSAAGGEFLALPPAGGEIGSGLRSIDDSIDTVSRIYESLPDSENDEKLSEWMESILGGR